KKIFSKNKPASSPERKLYLHLPPVREFFAKHKIYSLVLLLLIVVTYANAIGGDFVSDDRGIILNPEFLTWEFAATRSIFVIRPILYFIIGHVFGLHPAPFHILNIFFHAGTVLTVFMLLSTFVGVSVAFSAAAIFAVHPAISEAVTWISGGGYVQYSFFLLGSLLFYILHASQKRSKYLYASYVAAVLSALSGDRGILPFIVLLYVLLFEQIKTAWKRIIPYFIIAGSFIAYYLSLVGTRIASVQHEQFMESTILDPRLQIPTAISTYLEILVWPSSLTFYYSDFVMTDWVYALRIAVLVVCAVLAYITFRWFKQLFFWIAIFLLALAPTLTPWGLSSIVNERYGYLSSIGFILLVVYVAWNLWGNNKKTEVIYYILLTSVIAGLSIRTIIRNRDYRNEDTLWVATGKTAVYSPVTHMNLGDMHRRHKNFSEAEREFENALILNPNNGYALYNLGLTYQEAEAYEAAITTYTESLKRDPGLWQAHQNMGVIYVKLREVELAEAAFAKAIELGSDNPGVFANLAYVYMATGKLEQAQHVLNEAFTRFPNSPQLQEAQASLKVQ
ncbi:MAG: tetratricopeptide repeat protein, partial [Sinomicrobium sp.]|nr:tetratricopeptide repeat protein [Sinomicrobium sp.]